MPKEAITIEAAGREIRLSSPSKVYFPEPGHTKRDLAEYYLAVADAACPASARAPDDDEALRRGDHRRVLLPEARPEERARLARDGDGQVSLRSQRHRAGRQRRRPSRLGGHLGVIDFNPWPARRADLNRPDELRVDLDPTPESNFDEVRSVAMTVHETLSDHGLLGFPKTSGHAGSTSTSGSSRSGPSPRSAAPRWRWRARSSGGPSSRPRSGGRRSATGSSSTTTRTLATARSRRRGRCGRSPTPASRPRSSGTRCPTWTGRAAPRHGPGPARRAR